jgi:hypothetical protein
VPFGRELAAVYARHPIVVEALNPGFIDGFGHKPIHAFAAGGFMLVDRKPDFVAAFGEAGDAVSYAGNDDLAAKIDRYLSAPRYRREVGDAIRARIAERHSLPDVLTRILEQAAATETAPGPAPLVAPTIVTGMQQRLRRYSALSRSRLRRDRDGIAITTSPRQWSYAAGLRLAPTRAARLEATMTVETGCIDIGLLADDRSHLIDPKIAGPSLRPVTVTVELPDGRPNVVVLRNLHGGTSRVRLSGLWLRQPAT